MGLIKELALLPVAPLRFTVWVGDQLDQEAERRHSSPGAAAQRIRALEEARETGELEPEQAERLEGEVIEQQVAGPAAEQEEGGRGG